LNYLDFQLPCQIENPLQFPANQLLSFNLLLPEDSIKESVFVFRAAVWGIHHIRNELKAVQQLRFETPREVVEDLLLTDLQRNSI
jgi:hypothetical protein